MIERYRTLTTGSQKEVAEMSRTTPDVLATQQGELMGQLIGIRAKSQAQIYALLTPAQQQKLAQFMEKQRERRDEHKTGSSGSTDH